MKNKKQIPFNFELWGTERISVTESDLEILTVHLNPLNNAYYGLCKNGASFWNLSKRDLIMYQEVKPREVWMNESTEFGLNISSVYFSKENAKANERYKSRQVKFIEVINEEE